MHSIKLFNNEYNKEIRILGQVYEIAVSSDGISLKSNTFVST